ncbi:MAG: peptidylprolyl isomerase [Bacillota bacterium]
MTNGAESKERVRFRLQPQSVVILILALALLGTVFAFFYLQSDQVVATVNGEKITRDELFEAMYAQGGQEALDNIITRKLILQEGNRLGINVTEAEIDEEIEQLIVENSMGSEEELVSRLDYYGITMASFREDAMLNILARKIAQSHIEISEEEAVEYFSSNQESFNIPEEIEARHILVETEDEANEIIALLEQGGDFAQLAKERSQDPGSKDTGGNLGFFSRGTMMPEFEEVAFALAVGGRSEPVETSYGFHVIELLKHKESSEVSYEEVKDLVKERVLEEKTYEYIYEMLEGLRQAADIVYK